MEKSLTCEHLNKLVDVIGKELWDPKEQLACFDCGCPGPNLWICLQPECHHIGCSEVKNDHSTLHQKSQPSHCVHMNVSTERVWCYACEKEVHVKAALAQGRLNAETGSLGGSCGRLGWETGGVALNVAMDDEDSDVDCDRPRGLVGLQNLGNTCYMNAALQALSNTLPFTEYFLQSAPALVNTQNNRPALSRSYQKLIREMWSRKARGYVVPNAILYGIRNVHPMFRGYGQHDTQEFLRCFMDQLHEELKEPVWESAESVQSSDSSGDLQVTHMRRRAASSGASDAAFVSRMMRRPSPAPDNRYLRVHTQSESGAPSVGSRHKRSASFAGVQQNTYNYTVTSPADSTQKNLGSESELSCSSETEEKYETCSSNSDVAETRSTGKPSGTVGSTETTGGGDAAAAAGPRYRSIVSDVFDGKLLSAVQCLICDRVSTRVETFQDLSLPIPSREHLSVLRSQQPILSHHAPITQDSWVWWVLGWLRSWFYGPVVTLQDCLAAFFSADELKGDNMYSCSRCNKLRNGVKMSGVVQLPEVLCIHLKRFRHELLFSAKVGARVAFPLYQLDMAPYTHKECKSKISRYDLCAVIVHCGTAGGGHYTCLAKNGARWYHYDDTAVLPLPSSRVSASEAYVLLYKKVNPQMTELRRKAAELLETSDPDENKFYISRQWINKFKTWAEPGPIDNSDFVCRHGDVRPDRLSSLGDLCVPVPHSLWDFLLKNFGGGMECVASEAGAGRECVRCAARVRARGRRRRAELQAFYDLHHTHQEQGGSRVVFALSMSWFREWQSFVRDRSPRPPPPIDNSHIVTKQEVDGVTQFVLKPNSDYAQLSEELWRFFLDIYGGGPEVRLRSPQPNTTTNEYRVRKHSESDKEEYYPKSNSEVNITKSVHYELQKNQSLQNINRHRPMEDDNYRFQRHETNGNYPDTDEEMDVTPPQYSSRNENVVPSSSSDHDNNENPLQGKSNDIELPNMDSISLRNKPKSGKVRRMRRRTVK